MRNLIKLASVFLSFLLSAVLLSCGNPKNSSEEIVGKWSYITNSGNEQVYIFNSDGTIELETALGNSYGTYEVEGDSITYTMTMPNNKTKTNTITYKSNGDSLDLTINGNTYNYVKQ